MSRSRPRSGTILAAWIVLSLGPVACSSADPAADGLVDDAAAQEADPILAVKTSVRACADLAADVEAQGGRADPRAAEAEARLRATARRSVVLLGRAEFDGRPDVRNLLRVDFLYIAEPPTAEERSAALARAAATVAGF